MGDILFFIFIWNVREPSASGSVMFVYKSATALFVLYELW